MALNLEEPHGQTKITSPRPRLIYLLLVSVSLAASHFNLFVLLACLSVVRGIKWFDVHTS
jgi:hypothetical protein